MRIFGIDNEENFSDYKEQDFKETNKEQTLERWLEKNPNYILENQNVMIIGRQVQTNLNGYIDLLALDVEGNLVVIELKRDKTPRETLAQLIEYASYVEDLSYDQLEKIYFGYTEEEVLPLNQSHKEYFLLTDENAVSFNKKQILVIVGQIISNEVKQTSIYLRKKDFDIRCQEFRLFQTKDRERIISSEFVVNNDINAIVGTSSASSIKTDKNHILSTYDEKGKQFLNSLFKFLEENKMILKYGSKGFSINCKIGDSLISVGEVYPQNSYKDYNLYIKWNIIEKRINNYELIKDFIIDESKRLGLIDLSEYYMKTSIEKLSSINNGFFEFLKKIDTMIHENGLIGKES